MTKNIHTAARPSLPEAVRFRSGGFSGESLPDAAGLPLAPLLGLGLAAPPELRRPLPAAEGVELTPVKHDGNRHVFLVRAPRPGGGELRAYLKCYRFRSLLQACAPPAVCRARREWTAGRRAVSAGIPAAMPLLWARRRTGLITECVLVTEAVPGARSFHELWRSPAPEEARLSWLRSLARCIRRAHDLGFVHRDLSVKNVLVAGDPAAASDARFHFIDLGSASVLGRPPGHFLRMRDLYILFRIVRCPEHRELLLGAYLDSLPEKSLRAARRALRLVTLRRRLQGKTIY